MLPSLAYTPPGRCRDRKDDDLLEQAIRSRAEVLVTGYDDVFALDGTIAGLRILKPRILLDELVADSTRYGTPRIGSPRGARTDPVQADPV